MNVFRFQFCTNLTIFTWFHAWSQLANTICSQPPLEQPFVLTSSPNGCPQLYNIDTNTKKSEKPSTTTKWRNSRLCPKLEIQITSTDLWLIAGPLSTYQTIYFLKADDTCYQYPQTPNDDNMHTKTNTKTHLADLPRICFLVTVHSLQHQNKSFQIILGASSPSQCWKVFAATKACISPPWPWQERKRSNNWLADILIAAPKNIQHYGDILIWLGDITIGWVIYWSSESVRGQFVVPVQFFWIQLQIFFHSSTREFV